MKKMRLLLVCLMVLGTSAELLAQIGISSATMSGAIRPKIECEHIWDWHDKRIVGNNTKDFAMWNGGESTYSSMTLNVEKTGGRAKTTFTLLVDGEVDESWTWENGPGSGYSKTINLGNLTGKRIVLRVKNHSATNKIEFRTRKTGMSNSMFFNKGSNETITRTIESRDGESRSRLTPPNCTSKGSIEVRRLNGTSSAELVVYRNGNVFKTESFPSNKSHTIITLDNIGSRRTSSLKFVIRNIETQKFLKFRIGAWYN